MENNFFYCFPESDKYMKHFVRLAVDFAVSISLYK